MKNLVISALLLIMLTACDNTAPAKYESNKLVVSGYLHANRNLTMDNPVFVGKTVDFNGDYVHDILIDNAEVILINITTSDTYDLIFSIINDGYDNLKFGYYNENVFITSGHKYRIEVTATVDDEELFAWAETTVPEMVTINMDYLGNAFPGYGYDDEFTESIPEVLYEEIDEKFPIYFGLNNGNIIYTSYNFYCLEEFSTDLEWTQPFAGFTHLEEEDEEDYYSVMDDNLRESNMFWRYEPQQDDENNWYRLDEYYSGGFSFYGRWRLTIYIVDENFYTYNYHTESYLHGGIHGGIGYFGSVVGEDYYTRIIK